MLSHTSAHLTPIEVGTVGGRSCVVQNAIGVVARVLENAAPYIWGQESYVRTSPSRHLLGGGVRWPGLGGNTPYRIRAARSACEQDLLMCVKPQQAM
jgi:hypothetical protein